MLDGLLRCVANERGHACRPCGCGRSQRRQIVARCGRVLFGALSTCHRELTHESGRCLVDRRQVVAGSFGFRLSHGRLPKEHRRRERRRWSCARNAIMSVTPLDEPCARTIASSDPITTKSTQRQQEAHHTLHRHSEGAANHIFALISTISSVIALITTSVENKKVGLPLILSELGARPRGKFHTRKTKSPVVPPVVTCIQVWCRTQ
jgi:hypothetical protein